VQPTALIPGGQSAELTGVSCVSAGPCRAVGYVLANQDIFPIIEARDSPTGPWVGVVSPAMPPITAGKCATGSFCPIHVGGLLSGISCVSTSRCIAVGADNWAGETLAESWNGTKWTRLDVLTPAQTGLNQLSGVSCVSAGFCMAVGFQYLSTGDQQPLAETWSGGKWAITPTPVVTGAYVGTAAAPGGTSLNAVSCTSPTACTAVGTYKSSGGNALTLAERWNGSAWTVEQTPNPQGISTVSLAFTPGLKDVSCTGSTCTAVGTYESSPGRWLPLVEAWNGTSWTIAPTPTSSAWYNAQLQGVRCVSATTCVAVGSYTLTATGLQYQAEQRWNGSTWSAG
jgi:hypothetical protein